jgi:hypothetical protein
MQTRRLLAPIVMLVSDTAEQSYRFGEIVSVEPAFWNACVSLATDQFQQNLEQQGVIHRPRDFDAEIG